MKKVFIGLLVLLIVLSASAFIFIPRELTVSKVAFIRTNENALFRYLSSEAKWRKWWPANIGETDKNGAYVLNGFTYSLSKSLYHAVDVNMVSEGDYYSGRILILAMARDTVGVKWEATFTASSNPIARILNYREAKKIRKNMEVILNSLKAFNEREESVYAYHIHRTTIQDTFLVASKMAGTHYPSVKEIYDMVERLRDYIRSQGAKQTNYPMLNVTTNDSTHYTTMVALPTDKKLAGTVNISFKQMSIYKDKTVTAEVKGGPDTIKKAYEELNVYMNDYILSAPAIHWESLVTDRSKETDSTKWVTKIFMPIV